MRKFIVLALALVVVLGIFVGCATRSDQPGMDPSGGEPPSEQPAPAAGASGTTIIIHYYRYNDDYGPWDLWVWPYGKDGKGYKFTEKDDFGVKATIQLDEKLDKVGFIVRKGGDSWTAKDITRDRFIDIKDGRAEIWVVEGEEEFATSPDQVSREPKIKAAYLDSKRTITAVFSHPLELKGGTEGFKLNPPLKIDSVKDARLTEVKLIGFEFINGGKEIRFVLEPGRLGFRNDDSGKAAIYISGPFNAWGGTVNGKFTPMPDWKMKWNARAKRYELTAPVGTGQGQVPASGSEFKFTEDKNGGQEWYPSENIPIAAGSGKGTREVVITLAEDAAITQDYELEHDTLKKVIVLKRGVLNDPAFVYNGNDLGHNYSAAGTRFRLWAPTVTGVSTDSENVASKHAYPDSENVVFLVGVQVGIRLGDRLAKAS